MSKLELILFDIDGVLVDTVPLIRRTYTDIAALLGVVEPSEDKLRNAVRLSSSQAAAYLFPSYKERATSIYRHCWASNVRKAVSFQGIPELMSRLSESGFKLGTVTSRNQADANALLGNTGLRRWMDVVITWGDYRIAKPNPTCLLVAMQTVRIPAETAAYVGDQPNDILAARGADVLAIGATWDVNACEESLERAGADFIVAKPMEVMNLL